MAKNKLQCNQCGGKKPADEVIGSDAHESGLESPKGRTLLKELTRAKENPERFFKAKELVEMGYDSARPVIEKLLKKKAFGPHITNDLERFVYGDPWARPLIENSNYRALAVILNTDTSKIQYEDLPLLWAKQNAAYAALKQAGVDAIEAILPEFLTNPSSEKLGWLLLNCEDDRAKAAIEDAFESEKLYYAVQQEVAERHYKDPIRFVRDLLSSTISLSEKRQKISFLIRSLGYSQGKILYCGCGFPTEFLYDDGSQGPIFKLTKCTGGDRDWQNYNCPSCDRLIKRIPSGA